MIGETIGNFKIVSLLGRGGMGEVYLAHQTSIGTRVAVKVLLPDVSSDHAQVQRFFNEARAVSVIKHAGIAKIFDVGFHSSGRAYLIMEHLEGEGLGDRLRRAHRLPWHEVVDIGRQMASVLQATHTAGITHRDLKPDNVFLVPDSELPSGERVKILDFGIAKLTGVVSSKVPSTVGTMGTPTYMAPEQWGDSAKVDWRADTYSLGCLIYEIACGQPPFLGETFAELYVKHLTTVPTSIRVFDADLPEGLDKLLQHLLQKLPKDRPQSMAEVARAFDAIRAVRSPFDATIAAYDSGGFVRAGTGPKQVIPTDSPPASPKPVPTAPARPAAMDPMTSNTTLSRAMGESQMLPAGAGPNLKVIGGLVAAIVVVLGGIGVVLATRGSSDSDAANSSESPVSASPPPLPVADAAVAVVAVDAAPTLAERVALSNPFVELSGFRVLAHQVTREEYSWFLATVADAERGIRTPLADWGTQLGAQPVGWVTFADATAFCAAIGARLPAADQWTKLAGGSWGIDATGKGTRGPLREWTSTVADDLALVLGAHEKMTDAQRARAISEPMQKSIDPQVTAEVSRNAIANATIGFRCIAR